MGEASPSGVHGNTEAAVEAFRRGFVPVPVQARAKKPHGSAWTQLSFETEEQVRTSFQQWSAAGATNVGLILGERSRLVDVDLDNPSAWRLREHLLPPSPMQTGRVGNARSHRWYRVTGKIPPTRIHKMPDGVKVAVELRSTGAQTLIPPSVHPSGEEYRWEGQPWGGDRGPAEVDGRKLSVQVALLGLGAVLLDNWPSQGSRHEAYLALAGGLLRFGDGVHPFWKGNLPVLIDALADATHDDDADTRVSEVMGTTLKRLGLVEGKAIGFPRLAEIIGNDHAEAARRRALEVQALAGWKEPEVQRERVETAATSAPAAGLAEQVASTLPPEQRNPMAERVSTWAAVDMEPYLAGEVRPPVASVLIRSDGHGLMYQGRVNSLFGLSESAKSWIAMHACVQEIGNGDRVLYLDFEDTPEGTLARIRALGVGDDDMRHQWRYIHPEGPLEPMERGRFGARVSEDGRANLAVFSAVLEAYDPTLIVADGMTSLYGLHGHDTNEATATEVVFSWLKALCRNGRTTVIVIDHTGKTSGPGAAPLGAHHKIASVQGASLRVDVVDRPMPGAVGTVRLMIAKDRLGAVRVVSSKASEQCAAVVTIDSRTPGVTRMTLDPEDPGTVVIGDSASMDRKLERMAGLEPVKEAILAILESDYGHRWVLTSDLYQALDNPDKMAMREAWTLLVAQGLLERDGERAGTRVRRKPPAG